jgi:hypothetical protein
LIQPLLQLNKSHASRLGGLIFEDLFPEIPSDLLRIMHLLERNNDGEFSVTKDFGDDIPWYAILSHTWGADTEEVTFKDLIDGTGMDKAGYNKIRFCGEQARRDGLQYF